jgi:hypothetical protein
MNSGPQSPWRRVSRCRLVSLPSFERRQFVVIKVVDLVVDGVDVTGDVVVLTSLTTLAALDASNVEGAH